MLGKANSKSKKIKGERMEASGSPFVLWGRMKDKTGQWLRAWNAIVGSCFSFCLAVGRYMKLTGRSVLLQRSPLQKARTSSSVCDTMESAKMLKSDEKK